MIIDENGKSTIGVDLRTFLEEIDVVRGDIPDEARHVRFIGCPVTRQFELLELGQNFYLREIATGLKPNPNNCVVRLFSATLLNKMAVAVLKGNDLVGNDPEIG